MAIKVIVENKKKKKKKKLDPSKGAGAYVKDFYDSDAPQFKGKSKKKRREMAVAAYLDDKEELKKEEVEQVDEKKKRKKRKKSHQPTHKRSKKYFGSSFYDFGLLHGDSAGGDAGGDGGGGDGNRKKKEWSKGERKKRARNCSNPKGFSQKQFCKNIKSRSKKGEKKNELD